MPSKNKDDESSDLEYGLNVLETHKKGGNEYKKSFKGHKCTIVGKRPVKYELKCGKLMKQVLNFTAVNKSDRRARCVFKSDASLRQEILRQYSHFPLAIHPYSKLRICLEALTVVNLLLLNTCFTLSYCKNQDASYNGLTITVLESFYLVTMIANFMTGYVEGNTSKKIILNPLKIAYRYVTTYFIIDLFSVAGLYNYRLHPPTPEFTRWHVISDSSKILRLPTLYIFTKNLMEVKKMGIGKKTAVEIALLLYSFLQWNIFFQFAIEYYAEGSFHPQNPSNCSWLSITKLWNATMIDKFSYALHEASAMLRENSHLLSVTPVHRVGCTEHFYIFGWLAARLLVMNCAIIYMLTMFGLESSGAKYSMMAVQVETFMEQMKFPPRLKRKILKFYSVRFKSQFFVESRMIECMSGQLRNDIIMRSGRQLISDVEFLKTLPRSLHLQIGLKLTVVIFIAGDIILKINTTGDCMYFIDRGTVAIYSESGKEVCHLHDGDFFGEIALTLKTRYRTASVVAVSNCELFRLDRADFESTIACYPTEFEEIKRVAENRLERTRVMDYHHRSELLDYDDTDESIFNP